MSSRGKGQLGKVMLALEGAKEKGITSKEVEQKAQVPAGTASSKIHALLKTDVIRVVDPDEFPRRYVMAKYGGKKVEFRTVSKKGQALNGQTDMRIVITLNGERKSLTLKDAKRTFAEAKAICAQLKEIF